jgi:PRC-barrel domain
MNRCALRADWEAIVDHPLPWLRYVDADDFDDDTIDFDGMDVQSPTGEHLGDVEGFIVDSHSGRPYYVVADAGGWFKSKHFLLPVGHARFDADAEALVSDLDRDRVNRFPGFDKDEFDKLTEDDLRRINDATCAACSIEGVAIVYAADEPLAKAWDRPDFMYPDWWHANPTQPERMGERAVTAGAERPGAVRETRRTEEIRAREDDPSPHHGGRAQPGDVLGVETGGEQTHIGETADDENARRRDSEKTDAKRRRD